jgi:hypothetical protein
MPEHRRSAALCRVSPAGALRFATVSRERAPDLSALYLDALATGQRSLMPQLFLEPPEQRVDIREVCQIAQMALFRHAQP